VGGRYIQFKGNFELYRKELSDSSLLHKKLNSTITHQSLHLELQTQEKESLLNGLIISLIIFYCSSYNQSYHKQTISKTKFINYLEES